MEEIFELGGWIIWRNSGRWYTNNSGDIEVTEYLDDRGHYCVRVIDEHLLPFEVFRYSATVEHIDLLDDGAALHLLPKSE